MGMDGIFYDTFCDAAGHNNDQGHLIMRQLNQRIQDSQPATPVVDLFQTCTDKGFSSDNCVFAFYHGPGTTTEQKNVNRILTPERVSHEWSFAKVQQRCPFVLASNLMSMQLTPVIKHIKLAFLLTNIHTCFDGNQIALQYLVLPPTFREYMS